MENISAEVTFSESLLQTWICKHPTEIHFDLINWGMPLCDRFHQSQISHTRILRLSSYSRIRVLKATTARSPCKKIPKESMKAPFSQPRLLPGVGVEGADVLVKETTGNSAPPGPATSLSWEGMSAPLPAPIGQKNWTKNEVEAVAPQM